MLVLGSDGGRILRVRASAMSDNLYLTSMSDCRDCLRSSESVRLFARGTHHGLPSTLTH